MRKREIIQTIVLAVGLFSLVVVAGCSTHTAALDQAKSTYAQAQGNPVVVQKAPTTLYEAGQSLKKAEEADNDASQEHYAFLSQKQSEQAAYEAQRAASEDQIRQLGQQRQQILLQAKEQEATRAREQAELSQQEREQAKEQAARAQGRAQTAEEMAATERQRAAAIQQQEQQRAQQAQEQAEQARQQAQHANQQMQELQSQLSDLKARQTSQGVVLTMGDLMFETNKATLKSGAMLNLDRLAVFLKQHPDDRITIEGHTDSNGTAAYNRELSQQRADAVKDAMVSKGIDADRITARGYGESYPVASNDTAAGRQQNRRVDVVISATG